METGKLNITVRNLTPGDIPAIKAVEKQCFKTPWPFDSFENEMNNNSSVFIGAFNEDRLAGYMGSWIIVDEAHITTVAVDPEFRGIRMGKLLVWCMLDICIRRECIWATLEVNDHNTPARKLYEHFGFKTISKRKDYYGKGEDAHIMMLHHILRKNFLERKQEIRKEWEENLCLSWE